MTASVMDAPETIKLCNVADLVPYSGVAALVEEEQIALFYLPATGTEAAIVYAIGNFDPLGKANVLSRGIIGDRSGTPVVASPLYKQHYCLATGVCLEHPDTAVPTYAVSIVNEAVVLHG